MVRVLISNADLILTHPVGVNNADKLLKNPYDCISYTFLLSHGAGRLNLPIWYDESVLLNVDSNIFDPPLDTVCCSLSVSVFLALRISPSPQYFCLGLQGNRSRAGVWCSSIPQRTSTPCYGFHQSCA